jgi:hypothetical protein
MNYVATIAKAIAAGATALAGTFAVAYSDQIVTNGEWVTIVVAVVVALAAVYAVPNKVLE